MDEDGFNLCEEHYLKMKEKLKTTRSHTPTDCYCGKDHVKMSNENKNDV